MTLSRGLALNSHPSGRHFLQIPGPTPVPDRILRAIDQPTIDHRGPEFRELALAVLGGLREVFLTRHPVIVYPASGTGAWEAALVNTLSPGDTVLVAETGHFAALWKRLAERLGLKVEMVAGDWRRGADPQAIGERLRADVGHAIKAVCIVHNETSTGATTRVPEVRRAIDDARHPALFMVDSISGLGAIEYRHDDWGIDVGIAGSQKGLMLPPGLSFNALSERALAAARTARLPRAYWSWDDLLAANANGYFPSTPATNLLYGLHESIAMLREQGLEQVWARHRRHAQATRDAVAAWGLETQCVEPRDYSAALTTVVVPDGHDADALRGEALRGFNISLGQGLGRLAGRVFRIGHLGDLNDLTLIGALAGVEMALARARVPHRAGGVQAAMARLVAATGDATGGTEVPAARAAA